MKKIFVMGAAAPALLAAAFVALAAFTLGGCGTTKAAHGAATNVVSNTAVNAANKAGLSASNVSVSPVKVTILKWKDQNLGEPSIPVWLKPLVKGNSQQFRNEYADMVSPTDIVRCTVARNRRENVASTVADVLFAAQLANELKRTVLTRAGVSLQSGEFDVVNNAATEAKVTLVGNRRVTDFWQYVETKNTETGETSREYVYYIVYAMPVNAWDTMFAHYAASVFGPLPEGPGKKEIRALMQEMQNDTKREQNKSDQQFQAELAAQRQKLQNDYNIQVAQINAQTKQYAAQTSANSQALQAAYKSGNPSGIAAASTTPADAQVVDAMSTAARGAVLTRRRGNLYE